MTRRRIYFPPSREQLRRKSPVHFLRTMAERHPELRRPIEWDDVARICQREEVRVRVVELTRPARLMRVGQRVFLQLSKALSHRDRAQYAMHELAHFWRDDPGVPCYHSDDEWMGGPSEDFCDIFAWLAVMTPRTIRGTREEDFE